MSDSIAPSTRGHKLGLVLAGGAARGAYEVGVLEHLVDEVSRDLGYDVPLDILCGTSVGAINVCCLAAWADEPRARVHRLASAWSHLDIAEILIPTTRGVLDLARGVLGRGPPGMGASALFDATPLEQLLRRTIPFDRIDAQLRAGRVEAVTASATQVATGRAVVFVQRRRAHPLPWDESSTVLARPVRLRAVHALASAAVPMLFPAVQIEGRYYCDGGLRQNIPLSPARRLGAAAVIVVNPKHRSAIGAQPELERMREETFPSPLFLVGKTLNALLLDRIDNEIDRLEKVNHILDAGTQRFGAGFVGELSEAMGYPPGQGLRKLDCVHIRASVHIPELAADYVREPGFRAPGMLGRVMKRLAQGESTREADLLSYVLFDGEFAGRLIEIGRADARAHHAELCRLVDATCGERVRVTG